MFVCLGPLEDKSWVEDGALAEWILFGGVFQSYVGWKPVANALNDQVMRLKAMSRVERPSSTDRSTW